MTVSNLSLNEIHSLKIILEKLFEEEDNWKRHGSQLLCDLNPTPAEMERLKGIHTKFLRALALNRA